MSEQYGIDSDNLAMLATVLGVDLSVEPGWRGINRRIQELKTAEQQLAEARRKLGKYGDWCDLCDAPQWVENNGDHECRPHVESWLVQQRDDLAAALRWALMLHPCGNEHLYPNGGCPCACHAFPSSKADCERDPEVAAELRKLAALATPASEQKEDG